MCGSSKDRIDTMEAAMLRVWSTENIYQKFMLREKYLYHCKTMIKMGKEYHNITKTCIDTRVAENALELMHS